MSFNTMHYKDMDDGPDWRSDKCNKLTREYLVELTEKNKSAKYPHTEQRLKEIARHMAIDATYT